jgi:hypothetical protein
LPGALGVPPGVVLNIGGGVLRRLKQCAGIFALMVLAAASISAGSASAALQSLVSTTAQWQAGIAHIREPGTGCYRASYPTLRWHATRCVTGRAVRLVPRPTPRSARDGGPALIGGNGRDYSAYVSGLISQATGTFRDVSSNITEKGYPPFPRHTPLTANAFSLQLNSQFFSGSPACSEGSSSCQAWQQFVYAYNGCKTTSGTIVSCIYMQYWLTNYDATCPSHWTPVTYTSGAIYCVLNSNLLKVSALTASQLATVQLTGSAASGGSDGVALSIGSGQAASVSNSDSVVDLASHWNTTEWGVYGDGNSSEASFGANTTLEAVTTLTTTSGSQPNCMKLKPSFTAETNNLNLASTPALGSEPSPTMASTQTNSTGGTASCAVAAPDQVSLGTLCHHKNVQINAQNGCPYKGETKIGATRFHYLVLIENNNQSVHPAYWDLINFPRNTCQSIKLSFGMPTSGSKRKDTAWIKVKTKAGAQSLSVKYGQVATLTATVDGDAWSLENSATNPNDQIAINGTGSCSTRSGY